MTIPSPTYRLKPKSGDANPYNEVGGGNILSGATAVLTDRGGGDYAWRFSGGTCLATGLSIPYDKGAAAGGITMILTIKVITGPSIDFTRYAQCNLSSDSNTYLGVTQNGAGNVRSRFSNSSAGGSSFTIGSTETTLAIRVKSNGAGTETIDTWIKTVGRVGTTPDGTQSGLSTLNATFNQVLAGGGDSSVVDIRDLAYYVGEPTDAEMANMADNYRGTVDNPPVTIAAAWTEGNDVIVAAVTVGATSVTAALGWTEGNDVVAITGSVVPPSGTLVTRQITNNTGFVRTNLANCILNVYHPTTAVLIARFTGLTSDAVTGRLTVSDPLLYGLVNPAYEIDLSATGFGRRLPIGTIT